MKITIKRNPDQLELIKAIGSKDASVSMEALEALASFIVDPISTVLQQAGTVGMIYTDLTYNEDDSPSIPLDLYYDTAVNFIQTWSQSDAGGLPTSQVEGIKEMKVSTYRLDSAVSWYKKYARKSRFDVISKALERLAQEILLKQERNGWAVILKALAEASTNGNKHFITAGAESVFHINDLSRLKTRLKRILTSWAQGTPTAVDSKGLTDMFVSPEVMEQIRGFAFNPMNAKGVTGAAAGTTETGIPLPDNMREQIFRAAGASEFYGVNLIELNELGTTQKYNVLYAEFATASDTGHGGAFSATDDEILVGFDLGRECFIRLLETNNEAGGTLTVLPDDQWTSRSDKAGVYAYLSEGRAAIDSRGVCGLVV